MESGVPQGSVRFEWATGLKPTVFRNVRLIGSWDGRGFYSDAWLISAMDMFIAEDGCPAWRAEVELDDSQIGWTFHWGVVADTPQRTNTWAIPSELQDPQSTAQHCDFQFTASGQVERYDLTHCRRFGANKVFREGIAAPAIRFSVWAPNAKAVDLVIGGPASGYIGSDGTGTLASYPLQKSAPEHGIWSTDPALPDFADFGAWDHKPYMYRIVRDEEQVRYRTDIFSRCQIGGGRKDPEPSVQPNPLEPPWNGTREDLKGTKGCSVVIDPERVTALLAEPGFPPSQWVSEPEFWSHEYDPLRPVPDRLEELIIYEMHVEGLGAGKQTPGTFEDAINLLDHLVDLGINAVELLPTEEAESWTWGYGTSHYFATEYAGGGRDQLKFFVRACHQRGIAVLLDVVYNHYVSDAERAEWLYDTTVHHNNGYYWYQGRQSDWPDPLGGYLDNGSTGWTPNFRAEFVRKMFASSAAMLLTEFHIDGFRVDLTQAMHRDNVVHANGAPCPEANLFGAKALREWVRTLRLVKPGVMLTAEDHTGWRAITQPQETGGIGFDAVWWAEWYHNLIGDSQNDTSNARLIYTAGFGTDEPLAMSTMARILQQTPGRVIYHESHDQAGNASYRVGTEQVFSARTIQVAVNGHLEGNRRWAEARCRVACGLTLLAPGVPMFFMGEEVAAKEPYRYSDWMDHREDIRDLRRGDGALLFAFYRDVIRLRRHNEALISPDVEIVHVHDQNRVLAFLRRLGDGAFLIVVSLNNAPFADGYQLSHGSLGDATWIEVLNSDAALYGGQNLCNPEPRQSGGGQFNARLPANGIACFQRI
jgi:1,4-alpha-glucan branching enzyme